jgi:uncharacterized membrane protein YhaH (DUF805 family)
VKFGDAMIAGLKKSFQAKGRATRSEYWYFFLFVLILMGLFGAQARYFGTILVRSVPCIVNLQGEFHLHQITQPLSTIPGMMGLLALLAASALFLLGTGLTILVLIVPLLTLQARRLHDTGRSGWWVVNGNLALLAGICLMLLAANAGKPALSLGGVVVALGLFAAPAVMLYRLAQPGAPERNEYDDDRPEQRRRATPPPLSTEPLLPPAATPAE